MFERFTERARKVVVFAQDEARNLKHNYIGTEHLLLGMLREEEGLASRVLASLDVTIDEVRVQVIRIVGQGDEVAIGQIPFTPRAKKVLELALREALSLGHNYVGTEHLLLGLVREHEGVAARILLDFDADSEKVRNEIIRMLSGPGRGQPGFAVPAPNYAPALKATDGATRARTIGDLIDSVASAKAVAMETQDLDHVAMVGALELRLHRLLNDISYFIEPDPSSQPAADPSVTEGEADV